MFTRFPSKVLTDSFTPVISSIWRLFNHKSTSSGMYKNICIINNDIYNVFLAELEKVSSCSWVQAQMVWRSEVIFVSLLLLLLLVHPLVLLLRSGHLDEKLPLGLAVTVQLKAVFASDRLDLLPRAWVLPPVEDSGRHGKQRHGHKDDCCDHTWGQEEAGDTGLIFQDIRPRIQDSRYLTVIMYVLNHLRCFYLSTQKIININLRKKEWNSEFNNENKMSVQKRFYISTFWPSWPPLYLQLAPSLLSWRLPQVDLWPLTQVDLQMIRGQERQ